MRGVVVVGAGHAGVEAATSLRSRGYTGPVHLVAAEEHQPYERPPLSKELLDGGSDPAAVPLRPTTFFDEQDITLCRAAAAEVDRAGHRVRLTDGRLLAYDHLVLATGARPRRFDLPGRDLPGVFELRSLDDALAIRAALTTATRIVLLGGGFIGLEVASAARKRGLDVTVVELGDRVLGRALSRPVSEAVAAHHRSEGVRLLLGLRAVEVVGRAGRLLGVRTDTGALLPADAVVLGLGARAEDGLAAAAGLATDEGVLVDPWLTTSDRRISAIGDCAVVHDPASGTTRRLESIQNANDQGRYIAGRILGETAPYEALPWFWSNQGTLKLQLVNSSEVGDHLVRQGADSRFSVLCIRNGKLAAVESVNDPGTHMAARRLLEKTCPTEAQLAKVDFDLRTLARQVQATNAAVA